MYEFTKQDWEIFKFLYPEQAKAYVECGIVNPYLLKDKKE